MAKIEGRRFRTRKTKRTYFANAFEKDADVDPIVYAFYARDVFCRLFPIREDNDFANTIEGAKASLKAKVAESKAKGIVWF